MGKYPFFSFVEWRENLILRKVNAMSDQPQREMPRYKCHKEVWALKIAEMAIGENEESSLLEVEEGYGPIEVSADYMAKHQPRIGGYYVVYKDGYKSFSPAEAFEEGYTRI